MIPPMLLRSLIAPDSFQFRTLARTTWNEREDLRAAYSDPDTEAFDRWIAVNGVLEYPNRFSRYFPQIPPADLRMTGCGGSEAHGHLWSGIEDLEVVVDTYQTFSDKPFEEVESILDFGSGCGRLLRWFDRGLKSASLTGIDVRKQSVEWCRENLRGDFHIGPFDPPTELPSDSFDLVVALSLFSHFTRESNIAWLRELTRVCRPDGHMILTTHGALSLAAIAISPDHQKSFFMNETRAREILRTFHADTFHYHTPPVEWRDSLEVGENYGQAFMNEAFAAAEWSEHVEILGCIPARLFRFQDVFVVKPRA